MKNNRTFGLVDNALMTRSALIQALTQNAKDINAECGYPTTITTTDYRTMYDREGIATRVVEVLSQESWATDPEIQENQDVDETEFEMRFKEVNDESRLFHYMQRADEMSGIGSFGIVLFGIDDGLELNMPVAGVEEFVKPKTVLGKKPVSKELAKSRRGTNNKPIKNEVPPKAAELLYVRVFDQSLVDIVQWEKDVTNKRYGQPIMYNVTFANEADSTGGNVSVSNDTKKNVHWTRVVHLADNRKSSEVYGVPRQQTVYNRLVDLRKLLGGSAEMFWKGAFPGYSFEVDGDAADIEIDAESMRKEFESYSQGLQRYLALAGVSAKSLAPQVADPSAHFKSELEAIAITLGVPVRIFTGSEQAHLASTTDETTWNRRIGRRRTNYLTPYVIRPIIDRLIAFGVLPVVESYKVDWEDLNTPSDDDRAAIVEKLTNALAKYVAGGVDQIIPPREFLVNILEMDPEEVDEILDAAEELIAEEDMKAEEEQKLMAEKAAKMGLQPQSVTKEGGATFAQPAPTPVAPPKK